MSLVGSNPLFSAENAQQSRQGLCYVHDLNSSGILICTCSIDKESEGGWTTCPPPWCSINSTTRPHSICLGGVDFPQYRFVYILQVAHPVRCIHQLCNQSTAGGTPSIKMYTHHWYLKCIGLCVQCTLCYQVRHWMGWVQCPVWQTRGGCRRQWEVWEVWQTTCLVYVYISFPFVYYIPFLIIFIHFIITVVSTQVITPCLLITN